MNTELSSAFQYFSTTLVNPPKRRPKAHNFFASVSPFTVMTMVEPRLSPVICACLSQSSLINHRGSVVSCMPIDNSTSCFSNSISPSPKYLSKGIPCTFSRRQCSNISTPTTAGSTVLAARISKFDSRGTNNPAFAFSVSRANIAPDGAYLTRANRVSSLSPAFCRASFNASIKSGSDCCWLEARGKKILLP